MNRSRLLDAVPANRCLLFTLVVALAVRLSLAIAVQHQVDQPPARLCLIAGDAEGYWELAQHLVAGEAYAIYDPPRYVERVPGFSVVLALSQFAFGESAMAARCLLACLGTVTCGLTYWLGSELADETTGLIAAIYTAISPTLVLFSVLILSETAFAAALLLSLISIARMTRKLSPGGPTATVRAALMAGTLIGLATMVRPTWLYVGTLIALAVVFLCRRKWSRARLVQSTAGILLGVVVSMSPWTIRNYCVTGHLIPTTLWVGPSLYDGLNPSARGDSDMRFFEDDKLMTRMSEYEMDREYRRRALEFAARNPGRAVWLAAQKQQRYWSLVPNAAQFQDWRLKAIVCLTSLPLLVLAIGGLWLARGNLPFLVITAGPVLLFAALHLLFVGSLRYRLPAEYPLAVLAAVVARSILTRWKLVNPILPESPA
ncbi:MAG: glycosyltransferase family 39 protein [Planctomycetes bacterium]|nr:glycosyltransferase family 39 protein [Planctomycetota bacterium]